MGKPSGNKEKHILTDWWLWKRTKALPLIGPIIEDGKITNKVPFTVNISSQ
jgi:hypothetical protein